MWDTPAEQLQSEELSAARDAVKYKRTQLHGFLAMYREAVGYEATENTREWHDRVEEIGDTLHVCIDQLIDLAERHERKMIAYEVARNAIHGRERW